jgi:glycosyltransferase involved in cell wall biosynthesis
MFCTHMRIATVIPCVRYDDFLGLTLPQNLKILDDVTVLTAPTDDATIAVARQYGVKIYSTAAWSQGGSFNKAKALNEWLDSLSPPRSQDWVLTLDADVLLPPTAQLGKLSLVPTVLYGAHRRMCEDDLAWRDFAEGRRDMDSFPRNHVPIINGRVWGSRPTANPAALSGYFQLWHSRFAHGARRFPEKPSAAFYDVAFALSFPDSQRRFLDFHVLHLGPTRTNWLGRRSGRWSSPALVL